MHFAWKSFGTNLDVPKPLAKPGKFLTEIDYLEVHEGASILPGAIFGLAHEAGTHTVSMVRGCTDRSPT